MPASSLPGTVLGVLGWCRGTSHLGAGWCQVSKQAGTLNCLHKGQSQGLGAKVSKGKVRCHFHTPPWARPVMTQPRTLPSGRDGARHPVTDHLSPGEGPGGSESPALPGQALVSRIPACSCDPLTKPIPACEVLRGSLLLTLYGNLSQSVVILEKESSLEKKHFLKQPWPFFPPKDYF